MASMTKLRRRHLRWTRYAARTYWNPRITRPAWMGPSTAMAYGHRNTWNRLQAEADRRADAEHRLAYRPVETVDTGGLT